MFSTEHEKETPTSILQPVKVTRHYYYRDTITTNSQTVNDQKTKMEQNRWNVISDTETK